MKALIQLPSEAMWEYACRAGTTTPFSFGLNITTGKVNYAGIYPYVDGAKEESRGQPVPVGSLPPNAWGLCEMHGNVGELCADWYHESYEGAPNDGRVWLTCPGEDHVIRSVGGWRFGAQYMRSARRDALVAGKQAIDIGFRIACVQGS